MSLMITGLYASLTGLLVLVLTFNVVRLRRQLKIGVGDGGNKALLVASRAHGNLLENALMVLILMATAEASGLSPIWLHGIGTLWIIARLLHAFGLIQSKGGYHIGRASGTLGTWLAAIILILANFGIFLFS